MANGINWRSSESGLTMYATIRSAASPGYYFNIFTAAWEYLITSHWYSAASHNYTIPMSETPSGGRFYVANWPAALTAQSYYQVDLFIQLGTDPAIDDTLVGTQIGYWDGSNLIYWSADLRQIASVGVGVTGESPHPAIMFPGSGYMAAGLDASGAVLLGGTQAALLALSGFLSDPKASITGSILIPGSITSPLSSGTYLYHSAHLNRPVLFCTARSLYIWSTGTQWVLSSTVGDISSGNYWISSDYNISGTYTAHGTYTGTPTIALTYSGNLLQPVPTTDLADSIAALDTLIDGVEDKVDTIDTNVDTALLGIASIDGKVDTAISGISSIDGKVDVIDGEIGTLDDKVDIVDANVDTLLGRSIECPVTPGVLDLSSDMRFLDNQEELTYTHVNRPGANTSHAVVAVRLGRHRLEDVPTFGVYTRFKTSFQIPPAYFSINPKVGDKIEDVDHRVYSVIGVQAPEALDFWAIHCISLDIDASFDDAVTLYDASFADNNYAQRTTTYTPNATYSGVPCRIQPNVGHPRFFLAQKAYDYTWTIWCQYIPLTYGDLLLNDATDVYYKIVDFGSVDDLQSLMWINVIQNPVP